MEHNQEEKNQPEFQNLPEVEALAPAAEELIAEESKMEEPAEDSKVEERQMIINKDIKESRSSISNNDKEEKPERHWYAVHTYSGYEDAVARYLKQRIDSLAMHDKIFNVIVPKEKKIKIKNGKRRAVEEKIYPGYVLVDMLMTEDTWYVVRNTPRVTRFVGSETTKPVPLSKDDIDVLMARMGKDEVGFKIEMSVGDHVKVIDGPFKDYDGKVSEIDSERGRIKVLVQVFSRDTAVELDSLQVQKL